MQTNKEAIREKRLRNIRLARTEAETELMDCIDLDPDDLAARNAPRRRIARLRVLAALVRSTGAAA